LRFAVLCDNFNSISCLKTKPCESVLRAVLMVFGIYTVGCLS